MLRWDHKFELGHARIDAEHKMFLELIVEFQESIARGDDRQRQARILNEIGKCAEFHFVSEENLMTDCAFPEREAHTRQHARLLSELNDMGWRFRSNQAEAQDVFEFLFQWFALHITSEDRKLVGHLKPA